MDGKLVSVLMPVLVWEEGKLGIELTGDEVVIEEEDN